MRTSFEGYVACGAVFALATVFLLLIHPSFGFLIVFIVRVISRKVADAFGWLPSVAKSRRPAPSALRAD